MLPSETLLDIFPLVSRFELDNLKLVSRHICELIDGSAHLFSFRFFYNLKIDGAAYDFSIEIPNVSYRIIENPALEVDPDLSASHRIEEDPEVTLRHLRHAFVERIAISGVPSQTFVRALQGREHTFTVQTLVVGNADLQSMESEELRALIRSIPKLNQLSRPLAVYRVGKQSSGSNGKKLPRYTFVEFPSRAFALESLRAKHRLLRKGNGVDFSRVYLDPPMSKEERTRAYEARAARRKQTSEPIRPPAGSPTRPPTRFDQQSRVASPTATGPPVASGADSVGSKN